MAAVVIILGLGFLFTIIITLIQCLRCRQVNKRSRENINNNEPQNKVVSDGHCDSDFEDTSKQNGNVVATRKLPEIPRNAGGKLGEVVENGTHNDVYSMVVDRPIEVNHNNTDGTRHPYAKIGPHISEERDTDTDTYDDPGMYPVTINSQRNSKEWDATIYEPLPPPIPEKRFDEPSTSGYNNNNNSQPSTSAANAVAGQASEDIPLITPTVQDLYYSSQASDGYSHISVREPLTVIKSMTQTRYVNTAPEVESHYVVVPDDSDKMYSEIYSGQSSHYSSETYSSIDLESIANHPPPAPPTVESLRNVAQAHSRQASFSGFVSEAEASGGQQQKSSDMEEMYSKIDKNKKSRVTIHVVENISNANREPDGDIYTAVTKPKRGVSVNSRNVSGNISRYSFSTHGGPSSARENYRKSAIDSSSSASSSIVRRSSSKEDPGYEKIRESPWTKVSHADHQLLPDNNYETVRNSKEDFGNYETVGDSKQDFGNYETVRNSKEDFGNYETVRNSKEDFGNYETVRDSKEDFGNYETLRNCDIKEDLDNEPGYEKVLENDVRELSDAGYEVVGESSFQRSDPNYESLRYNNNNCPPPPPPPPVSPRVEPSSYYATVDSDDPLYEKINGGQEDEATGSKHSYERLRSKGERLEGAIISSEVSRRPYERSSNAVALHISWTDEDKELNYDNLVHDHQVNKRPTFDDSDSLL